MRCKMASSVNTQENDGNKMCAEDYVSLYHEKQSRELCALHALNNLFQQKMKFTKKELDEICVNLAPNNFVNPHKSLIGLGNYDVNVIMTALSLKNHQTVWFDKRRDVSSIDVSKLLGFILNVPSDMKWGMIHLPIQRKHWIAVRQVNGIFYNFDSKLKAPEEIGPDSRLTEYLREQMESKEKQLFLVLESDVNLDTIWTGKDDEPHKSSVENNSNGDSGVGSQSPPDTPTKHAT